MFPVAYPTIPLVGGPFDGQRRPIIDGHVPDTIERLPESGGPIQMYERMIEPNGANFFLYKGARPIGCAAAAVGEAASRQGK